MTDTIITVRCWAFSFDSGPALHRCYVDGAGTVRVWDRFAEHYTLCHDLSQRTQSRIRSLAAVKGEA